MNTRNHPIDAEELMVYLDGELAPEQRAVISTHLDECVECQTLAADLRSVSDTMKTWTIEAPADSTMSSAISAAVDEHVSRREAERVPVPAIPMPWQMRVRKLFRRPAAYAVVAASLGVLFIGLIRLIGRNSNAVFSQVASVTHDDVHEAGTPSAQPYARLQQREKDQKGIVGGIPSLRIENAPVANLLARKPTNRVDQITQDESPAPPASTSSPQSHAAVSTGPMIIRTAALALTTKDFDAARARIEPMLQKRHGYLGSLNVTANPGAGRTLTAILRVPSMQLNDTLAELKTLGRLDGESQTGEDVTSQYVDLQARLANSRHTEQRLIDLLANRTGKLSDVLDVENELARVRGEIESMEAERKTMANQVDFATINLTINEDYRAQLQVVPPSTTTRLVNAAVAGYRGVTDSVMSVALFFLESGPTLLLWLAVLFFPARYAWKKLRAA